MYIDIKDGIFVTYPNKEIIQTISGRVTKVFVSKQNYEITTEGSTTYKLNIYVTSSYLEDFIRILLTTNVDEIVNLQLIENKGFKKLINLNK